MDRANAGAARARRGWLRPMIVLPSAIVAAALLGVALYLFQPWKLWVDEAVDEALAAGPPATATGTPQPSATADASSPALTPPTPTGPRVLAHGSFISHEHSTTGSVRVLEFPDGARVLRIEDLTTSNGPDLHVWITDAPVIEGRAGWSVFDDGRYVALGKLKGNLGSQNYDLPAEVDLAELGSVSIWCDRFNVSFGAAKLVAPS